MLKAVKFGIVSILFGLLASVFIPIVMGFGIIVTLGILGIGVISSLEGLRKDLANAAKDGTAEKREIT